VIAATGLELRAGAHLLLEGATFQISPGDKVGLVGRNGAGKTTLARVLAGDGLPATGTVQRRGTIGYLPQDSRAGDLTALAMDRILSSRGLDEVRSGMRAAEEAMSDPSPERRDAAVRRYSALEERLVVLGGYAAEAEAAAIASSLGLPDRVVAQPLHTLSGGQRRRVELARILFSDAQTLLLDEPTNHLDADSIAWLRDHLRTFRGSVVIISHDPALLEAVVGRIFHLDADRAELDIYNVGWRAYLQTPLTAEDLSKSYGSLEVFTDVDVAVDRGARIVILGLNGAGKTTLLRLLNGLEPPDTGRVTHGHGLRLGYYAQEHETLDGERTVLENMRAAAPEQPDGELRGILGSFLFSGDAVAKPAAVLSGGEKTRLALALLVVSGANVLLLDEPTNNLDPASRAEILTALRRYRGAIVLVTHDEGAVEALAPERVILLPDGIEDSWSEGLSDLVALA
jgi:ATPase subunit of ABC transporter with duplicated ATPase domains